MPIPDYTEFVFDYFAGGDFNQGTVRAPYAASVLSSDKGRILRARPGQAVTTGCIPGRTVTIKEVVEGGSSTLVLSSYIGAARAQGIKLEFVPFAHTNELHIYGDSLSESRFEFYTSTDKREAVNGQLQDFLGTSWRVRDYSRDGATSNESLNGGAGGNFNGAPFGPIATRRAALAAGELPGTRIFAMHATGTNDIQTGVSFATYQSNTLAILAYLETIYEAVVIAGIPHRTQAGVVSDYEAKRREWNTWLESLTGGHPTRTFAQLDRDDWRAARVTNLGTIDGIHLSAHWAPYLFAYSYGVAAQEAKAKADGAALTVEGIAEYLERNNGLLDIIRDRVVLSLPNAAPGTSSGLPLTSGLPPRPSICHGVYTLTAQDSGEDHRLTFFSEARMDFRLQLTGDGGEPIDLTGATLTAKLTDSTGADSGSAPTVTLESAPTGVLRVTRAAAPDTLGTYRLTIEDEDGNVFGPLSLIVERR